MSRSFDESDYDPAAYELWRANVTRALKGRRGQRFLHELREALEALPERRLISGFLADPAGSVCTIGAFLVHRDCQRGVDRQEAVQRLMGVDSGDVYGDGLYDTVRLAVEEGVARTLAWQIAYENDFGEWCRDSPEERFDHVLAWIDRTLVAPS